MRSRFISVTNAQRVHQLKNKYGLKNISTGESIFELDDLNSDEYDELKRLCKNFDPFLVIVADTKFCLFIRLIPVFEFMTELKNLTCNNRSIKLFFERVIKYFTKNQKECWNSGHFTINFADLPLIMGIVNVTPDSFFDGGKYFDPSKAIDHALQLTEGGADIIDIGGESTRPGAEAVLEHEELKRVVPVIEGILKQKKVLISIDTYKSSVAKVALEAGAAIINDISGTLFDDKMKGVICEKDCPVIIMHTKGKPKEMQLNPEYADVSKEIYYFLEDKSVEIGKCNKGKVVIDPGIGFGKTLNHNMQIIRDLKDLTFLDSPVLVGLSRKSFIGKALNVETENRLVGSLAAEIYSILNGADIIRVHEVDEILQAKKILNNIKSVN